MSVWAALAQAIQSLESATTNLMQRVRDALRTSPEARQAAFSMAVVALAAKLAKADGVVSMSEVESFWRLFSIPAQGRPAVRRLFELAQRDVAGYQSYAHQITRLFPCDMEMREDLLEILFTIAAADRVIHECELQFLEQVAEIFEIEPARFERIKSRHIDAENNPWAVLGVDPNDDFATVRKRYLALVSEHHPDRLLARGVPQEFVRVANDRLAAINNAYDAIEQARS